VESGLGFIFRKSSDSCPRQRQYSPLQAVASSLELPALERREVTARDCRPFECMGQEKSAVRRFATFTHCAQFFHNANLLLQMNIFLILLGETKEFFV
jgi:hypothetical protein